MTVKRWRALIRKMRERFPAEATIHVRRRPLKDDDGYVTFRLGVAYCITINSQINWNAQIDTLIHEWAHVLAVELACNHGAQWGITYAEIYRAYDNNFQAEEIK